MGSQFRISFSTESAESTHEAIVEAAQTIDLKQKVPPFTIEALETGLRMLDRSDVDLKAFWDENIIAFRQTVLVAIRETSDALLSPKITLRWRIELESQLETLVGYLKLADRYMALRAPGAGQVAALRRYPSNLH